MCLRTSDKVWKICPLNDNKNNLLGTETLNNTRGASWSINDLGGSDKRSTAKAGWGIYTGSALGKGAETNSEIDKLGGKLWWITPINKIKT